MEMKSLMTQSLRKNNLKSLLLEEHSKEQVHRIIAEIKDNPDLVSDLWDCYAGSDRLLAQRSSWVMQHYYRAHPSELLPYFNEILEVIQNPLHDAQVRCALSVLQNVEIPERYAGRIYDISISQLANPSAPAALRVFGMQVATNIAQLYPELAEEIIQTYQLQEAPSAGLRSRWKKIHPQLKILVEKNKQPS